MFVSERACACEKLNIPVNPVVLLGSHLRGRPGFRFLMPVPLAVSLLSVSDSAAVGSIGIQLHIVLYMHRVRYTHTRARARSLSLSPSLSLSQSPNNALLETSTPSSVNAAQALCKTG